MRKGHRGKDDGSAGLQPRCVQVVVTLETEEVIQPGFQSTAFSRSGQSGIRKVLPQFLLLYLQFLILRWSRVAGTGSLCLRLSRLSVKCISACVRVTAFVRVCVCVCVRGVWWGVVWCACGRGLLPSAQGG